MCLSAISEPCEVQAEVMPCVCLSAISEPCEVPAEGADLVAVDRFVDWFADGASAVQVATGGNSDGQSVEADWVKVGDAPVANPVDADDCKSSGDAISGHVPSRPVATPARTGAGPVLGLLATPAKPTAAAVSKDAEYDKACAAELTLPDKSWLWGPRMDDARVKLTKVMRGMSECEESQGYLEEFWNTLANLKPGCLDTISEYHPFPRQSAFWQLCAENAKWENLSVQLQEAINEVASLGCRLQGEYLMFAGPPLLATPAKPTAAAAVSEDAASEDAAYDKACEAEDDDDEWGTEGVDWHWTGQGCFRFDRFDSMYKNMISI